MHLRAGRLLFFALMLNAGIVACAGSGSSAGSPSALVPSGGPTSSVKGSTPISHVVIIVQENRSFDNFFATFPHANGTTVGEAIAMPSSIAADCAYDDQQVITYPTTVPLTEVSLQGAGFPNGPNGKPFGENEDLPHTYLNGYLPDCNADGDAAQPNMSNACEMNGFDLQHFGPDASGGSPTCTYLYQYVNPKDIAPYWDMAEQYVLADNTFQSQGSSSFTAHQDLIAAGTSVTKNESAIDNVTGFPWGCDSGPNATTPVITISGQYIFKGPFPCYPAYSSYPYETMRDLLDAKDVSWKYYTNKVYPADNPKANSPDIWSAFDAIYAVRYGTEWGTRVTWPDTNIFKDIKNGPLPAVAWLMPDAVDSDHPAEKSDKGPSWVASVVNAIGQSRYWKTTAIVVIWDDWGGFYDHVQPPLYDDQGGLGFRIPMIIISPYVQPHVEHTQYETASVLKFIEKNWNLGTLGKLDRRAASIGNAFNFSQTPRPFQVIPAKYPQSYFLHQKPSGIPPDTE
jgi:phospholipase C